MSQPLVLVTRPIPEAGLELLRRDCRVVVRSEPLPPTEAEMLELVPGVDGILSLLTDPVTPEVIRRAGPGLKVISNFAVGCDNIAVKFAASLGIPVGFTPDVLTETTADLTFALLLAAARRLPEGAREVARGGWRTWEPLGLLGMDVHHSTIGILGMGRIGRAVARRAAGFSMEILYLDPRQEISDLPPGSKACAGLDELLTRSDFVTLHLPLTPETRGCIAGPQLALMKPTAVLVNTGRGALVDTEALVAALAGRMIFAAALDVTDPEPLPMDHPLVRLDNCLIVPHIGSASVQTRARMAVMAAENLLAGVRGLPLPNQFVC